MSRERERLRAQDDADEREAEGQLVADHLRGGAERAEQRELVVRRPAGERDAVDADGGDAEDDQQADVDVGDLNMSTPWTPCWTAPKGTTAMEMSAQVSAMMGARMKSGRSEAMRHAGLP